jgi:hypothetical protein
MASSALNASNNYFFNVVSLALVCLLDDAGSSGNALKSLKGV